MDKPNSRAGTRVNGRGWSLTVYSDNHELSYVLLDAKGERYLSRDEGIAILERWPRP